MIGVFVDTATVNRILDIKHQWTQNPLYEEDRTCLSQIVEQYVRKGLVRLIVNPSVEREINNTKSRKRRQQLLNTFSQLSFTPYNKTVFPFAFPAHFVTEEEKAMLDGIRRGISGFEKDEKMFLDALSNSEVDVLLTTDRQHLADKGLDAYGLLIFTPKQLLTHLQATAQGGEHNA